MNFLNTLDAMDQYVWSVAKRYRIIYRGTQVMWIKPVIDYGLWSFDNVRPQPFYAHGGD